MSLCFLSMETSKVFNKRILESLEESGFEGLSEALIVLFPYIYEEQIITSAKLAKKVGYSRQAMHKNIKKLVDFEYIILVSHNEKEKSIELTPKGLELINKANEYISNVEKDLSKLIGKKELDKYKETQSKIYEYLENTK
ncbi:transcriptional regulator, MarR family [Poseidonibacter lekithochrous]|nr:transcriptional regulator, MarR family [Poseidonibacter lekithochrous]